MKQAEVRAIVHNVADSLASGIGLLIGYYETDVFGEASRSEGGSLLIDLLEGRVTKGTASESLSKAVSLYREAFEELCTKAGCSVDELCEATVRYWSDTIDRRFDITIEDSKGRRSTTEYVGVPGRRRKVMDGMGRVRPKPSLS